MTATHSSQPQSPVAAFLANASMEITPRQVEKLPLLVKHLRPGARVFIALIDPAEVAGQITAAKAVRQAGFDPVPHIPARFVRDAADLDARVAGFVREGGVSTVLALGGGAAQPMGAFDSTLQMMATGVFERHGITTIGIAGHPEGNPDIEKIHGEAMLLRALKDKQQWLNDKGRSGFIATQFLFEAAPLAAWAAGLRKEGITLPIAAGIPGPATIKTLVKYAAMCGVGNSARFIKKQALNITKLLTVSAPDDLVEKLAVLHEAKPELGIAAPHLYPFGGFDKLFDWMAPKLV